MAGFDLGAVVQGPQPAAPRPFQAVRLDHEGGEIALPPPVRRQGEPDGPDGWPALRGHPMDGFRCQHDLMGREGPPCLSLHWSSVCGVKWGGISLTAGGKRRAISPTRAGIINLA